MTDYGKIRLDAYEWLIQFLQKQEHNGKKEFSLDMLVAIYSQVSGHGKRYILECLNNICLTHAWKIQDGVVLLGLKPKPKDKHLDVSIADLKDDAK